METTIIGLKSGDRALISGIKGGAGLFKRLNAMGIFPGKEIKKISSNTRGPVIIEVMNSRVAIGRGMAEKIIVRKRFE